MQIEGFFHFTFYEVSEGVGAIIFSNYGLSSLFLPFHKKEKIEKVVYQRFPQAFFDENTLASLKNSLRQYFQGKEVSFSSHLDLRGFSPFERRVYQVLRGISYGETRSYKWLAERLRRAQSSRAVGLILRKNPLPIIIPCHRVIRGDGSLGGFSAGIRWKKRLLELEAKRVEKQIRAR